jgi:tetratricopeptide (TPR) repeat protein
MERVGTDKSDESKRKPGGKSAKPDELEKTIAPKRERLEKVLGDIQQMVDEQESMLDDKTKAHLEEELSEIEGSRHQLTPVEEAQEVVYKAWEVTGPQRVELALHALEISSDCADAYLILAEETAEGPEDASRYYQQAVMAGERVLGPRPFREDVGDFWNIVEARPYMRARAMLADSLWSLGQHRLAVIHYKELLRLDSGDNQGIRYRLINCLLEEGLHEDVKELIVEYRGDETPVWLYGRSLWAFLRYGPGVRAGSYLKEARTANPFVPDYLLGLKAMPAVLPDYSGWGDESEAILYAADALKTWQRVPGALEWLKKSTHT